MQINIEGLPAKTEETVSNIALQLNTLLSLGLDELSLHFISDEALLQINVDYLQHDYYTDIITFDLRDDLSKEAELFISMDRVAENATAYQRPYLEELVRVVVHGLLHLSGQGDKSEQEAQEMKNKENFYLEKLFHVKQV